MSPRCDHDLARLTTIPEHRDIESNYHGHDLDAGSGSESYQLLSIVTLNQIFAGEHLNVTS